MSANLLIIECGMCGETRLESLAEAEIRDVSDASRPLSRFCGQCGSTTGWVAWRERLNAELLNSSTHNGGGKTTVRPVPAGQERLASQLELDSIGEFLQQRNAQRLGRTDERGRPLPRQDSNTEYSNSRLRLTPRLVSNGAMVDGEGGRSTLSPDLLSRVTENPVGDGEGINRFLLCTIVWSVAREVKARGKANGENLSLPRIAREILSSYLQVEASSRQNLLDKEPLENEIKRRLYELVKQSRMQHAKDGKFDLESLVVVEQTQRRRQSVKH